MIVKLEALHATLENQQERLIVILDGNLDKRLGAAGRDKLIGDLNRLTGMRVIAFSETEEATGPELMEISLPAETIDSRWAKLKEFNPLPLTATPTANPKEMWPKCPRCIGTAKPIGHRGRHTKYVK